jgi:hypothetical protein
MNQCRYKTKECPGDDSEHLDIKFRVTSGTDVVVLYVAAEQTMTKHWMHSSLPASLAVSEFHTAEAYSNLVLTNVQCSFRQRRICTHRQYKCIIQLRLLVISGPGSSVGIATDYGLDGPGIESRRGAKLSARPDRPWSQSSLLYNGYRVFPGGKVRACC